MNDAFTNELQKLAFNPTKWGPVKDTLTVGRRLMNPVSGMKEGWKALAPKPDPKVMANQGKNPVMRTLKGLFGQGEHLSGPTGAAGIQGAAEDLSRRGWTGAGRLSKYAPVGGKTQMALGTAASVPAVVQSARSEDRERGFGSTLGENAGFAASGLLTAGTGMMGVPLSLGIAQIGKQLGRQADRLGGNR